MKREVKYVFEGQKDISTLMAVKKFIGKSSLSSRIDAGLTECEAELCSDFYDLIREINRRDDFEGDEE